MGYRKLHPSHDACPSARPKWVVGLGRSNRTTCQKQLDVLRVESCRSALGAAIEANPNVEKDQETGLEPLIGEALDDPDDIQH